jgi:hypothetical protein
MNLAIYEKLKETARAETTITYGEIAPLAGLDLDSPGDRTRLAHLLDDINEHEVHRGWPLLSGVVWSSGEGSPGNGFFSSAARLGKYSGNDELQRLAFLAKELKEVYARWKAAGGGAEGSTVVGGSSDER